MAEVVMVVILAMVSGVLVLSIIEIAISCWYLNHFSEILLRMLMIVIMIMSIPSSIARLVLLRIHNFIRPLFIQLPLPLPLLPLLPPLPLPLLPPPPLLPVIRHMHIVPILLLLPPHLPLILPQLHFSLIPIQPVRWVMDLLADRMALFTAIHADCLFQVGLAIFDLNYEYYSGLNSSLRRRMLQSDFTWPNLLQLWHFTLRLGQS